MLIKNYDLPAIYTSSKVYSYKELLSMISSIYNYIICDRPSKVAICFENRPEWCATFYGVWSSEAIAVPIDYLSTSSEISYILNDSKPEIIFYSNETAQVIDGAISDLEYNIKKINIDEFTFEQSDSINTFYPKDINKTAHIIYTSGTTGGPKGVMLSFKNILANIDSLQETKIYTESDRTFVLLPYHHTFPLMGSMIIPFFTGGSIVFPKSMKPDDLMDALVKHKVTLLIAVPRFYNLIHKGIFKKINSSFIAKILYLICKLARSSKLSKIIFKAAHKKLGSNRYMVCGGAAIDVNIAKDFRTLGFKMLEGYGMTETSPMITFTRPDKIKPGSPGQIIKGCEVKIVDGEITCRGDNVMQGYFNRPKETQDVIKDGWLHTGDLGEFDKDGFLHVTGRKKDIIVLPNGKNINPEEAEFKIELLT